MTAFSLIVSITTILMLYQSPMAVSDDHLSTEPQENELVPFKVLFVVHQTMKPENKAVLDRVFKTLNLRIHKMLRSPPIQDVRFRRAGYDRDQNSCGPPQANNRLPIPSEFAMPCYDKNGRLVPENDVPSNATKRIEELAYQNFTHVVFVGVYNDTVPSTDRTCNHNAWSGMWMADRETGRPTHGGILICWQELWKVDEKTVENLLAHELLHVVGVNFQRGNEGVTWKQVTRPWMDKNGKIRNTTLTLSMLPSVVQAARAYFKCPTLDGALVHHLHLPQQQYEQEVLARVSAYGRVSALSLGALKDTEWYEVDMTAAEPMTFGQAAAPRCDVNGKSCHQIVREAGENENPNVWSVAPYCVPGKSPLCSIDGRTRLECFTRKDCPILVDSAYKHEFAECELNTKIPHKADHVIGARVGKGSMCLSFNQLAAWKGLQNGSTPLCVHYSCDHEKNRISFSLYPNGVVCKFHCDTGDSNKMKQHVFEGPCNSALGGSIRYWCPELAVICKNVE